MILVVEIWMMEAPKMRRGTSALFLTNPFTRGKEEEEKWPPSKDSLIFTKVSQAYNIFIFIIH